MARNTKVLTIQEDKSTYRDNGRQFLITEMPADQGEEWANRLIFALANAGADLPDGVIGGGMAGLSAIGVGGAIVQAMRNLQFDVVKPLFDEMMACVQTRINQNPWQAIVHGVNCQIEEIFTFWTLRLAWLELHTGFSIAGAAQPSKVAAPASSSSPST